ncbi:MAG: DeoR/GlpR family DNA-binding transcription regulator, partial [Chloroflexota bacterium]
MAQLAVRRRRRIVELTNQRGAVSVQDLCDELGVSDMTVRRDLRVLIGEGAIRRTHGGAMSVARTAFDFSYDDRQHLQVEAKGAIGEAAARLISNGDTVFLNCGTTIVAMARHLHDFQRLTVVSNSIEVVQELVDQPGITVISTGGVARQATGSLVGHITESLLDQLSVRKAFLGTTAVSPDGFSNSSVEEAAIQRKLISTTGEVFYLADHTKFGKRSF